ncbi:hypothetical protein LSH36_147g04014 [Paralvinella palmiformis]|uniref:Nucleolar protein 6 n=1 Tax=Paralvinella palmiformis TaxID=53620 RepID=A0AAD9JUU6_9ANNE|nr:hypothetical protein LSH36_147g04014 [Paralvinella palmiformis]
MNQRYLRKRAFYLAVLARKLRSFDDVQDLTFTYHQGNAMRPILIVKPKGKGFKVRLHPYPEEGVFRLNRFHLDKNNVRQWWYRQEEKQTAHSREGDSPELGPATPHYNVWILRDLVWDVNEGHAVHQLWGGAGLTDGISLLKVWLHQRELDQGIGSFSNYIMLMFVVYLLSERKLSPLMSSYQVMRNTLLQLSQSDWCNHGISLAGDVTSEDDQPSLEDFHRSFDVVFIDRTGYLNLTADVCRATWDRVKHEARLSIEFLETPGVDAFETLFMTPVKFINTFDQCFHVKTSDRLLKCAKHLSVDSHSIDVCGITTVACLPKLIELLYKALGKRIQLLGLKLTPPDQWNINESPPTKDVMTLTFGLLLNPEAAMSMVDKGPSADSPEAAEFRQFWGDKSELRRFQDGSICEAAVWSCKTLAERRKISAKIVKHILNRYTIYSMCNLYIYIYIYIYI